MEKVEEKTDRIFVPIKKPVLMGQTGDFSGNQPIWLPNSSIVLYQLFPSDLLEQMRIKLEILKDLLNSKSQYATVEVKNGKFCQYVV